MLELRPEQQSLVESVAALARRQFAARAAHYDETASFPTEDFEDLLGVPREHLEFTLWYLKEGQFVARSDNGKHSITLKGVDLTEALTTGREPVAMLEPAMHGA